jgi:hypothetical protein
MRTYYVSGGIAPSILNLSTRWRWVVKFMPHPLYPLGKTIWYPLDGRLGKPHSQSGCHREEKDLFTLLKIETQLLRSPAFSY